MKKKHIRWGHIRKIRKKENLWKGKSKVYNILLWYPTKHDNQSVFMDRKKSNNNCLLWCDWLFQLSTHLYFSLMMTLMIMWWQTVMRLLVKHSNHLHEHHVTSSSQESHWNFIEKSVKRRTQKNNTRKIKSISFFHHVKVLLLLNIFTEK